MKLVEILARELEVWPEGAHELGQWPAGEVCIRSTSTGHPCTEVYTSSNIADDVDAWCTRPQWQAERDRMKAMKFIDRTPQALLDQLQRVNEPNHEQQLWDRVAVAAMQAAAINPKGADGFTFTERSVWACDQADAFMAERAKRVGK